MLLFLVLSAPLFALVVALLYRVTDVRASAALFLRGLLWAVPLLLPWWLLNLAIEHSYVPENLFLYHFVLEMLYPLIPALVLFYLFERGIRRERGYIVVVALGAFLAGAFFVQSIVDVLRFPHYYSPYIVFLLPTLRLGLIATVPPLLGAASREPRPLRVIWVLGVLIIPALFTAVPLLHELRFDVLSHALTVLFATLAVFIHVGLMDLYFPRRPRSFTMSNLRRRSSRSRDSSAARTEAEPAHTPVTEV
jgi:hypothetical protein